MVRYRSNDSSLPALPELSESISLHGSKSSRNSHVSSALTAIIHSSPPAKDNSSDDDADTMARTQRGAMAIISQPSERMGLLVKVSEDGSNRPTAYGAVKDLESQTSLRQRTIGSFQVAMSQTKARTVQIARRATNPKSWDAKAIWREGIRRPIGYSPAVLLGLLLNILDALSYGKSSLNHVYHFSFSDVR